jgi:hypothetical protein
VAAGRVFIHDHSVRTAPWLARRRGEIDNQELLGQQLRRSKDRAVGIDDTGRSVGHQIAGAACDIGTDDPHAVFRRPGNVCVPRVSDNVRFLRGETVVRRHEDRGRTQAGHDSRRLGMVGVVADDDAERQAVNTEDRDPLAGPID